MQKAKNAPAAAEDSLFGFMEGKAPEAPKAVSETVLESSGVDAATSVEAILAETAAKLERRAAEIAQQQVSAKALAKEKDEKSKELEAQAQELDAQAAAQDELAAAWTARIAGIKAMVADDSAADGKAKVAA